MVTELKPNSHVKIPEEFVSRLGLSEGRQLEIFERDGAILIVPVEASGEGLAAREQEIFDDVDALFEAMETD